MRILFFVLVLVSAGYISYQEVPEIKRWLGTNMPFGNTLIPEKLSVIEKVVVQDDNHKIQAMQQEIESLKASQTELQKSLNNVLFSQTNKQEASANINTVNKVKPADVKANERSADTLLELAERMEMKSLSLLLE